MFKGVVWLPISSTCLYVSTCLSLFINIVIQRMTFNHAMSTIVNLIDSQVSSAYSPPTPVLPHILHPT